MFTAGEFGSRTITEKIVNAEMVDGSTDDTPFLFPSYDVYGKFVAPSVF